MDPLTWAYLALMAASTASSAMGQRKVGKERAKVMHEDRLRRRAQQSQTDAAARNTQEAFARSRAEEDARAKTLGETYKQPETAPVPDAGGGVRLLDALAPTTSTRTIEDYKNEMGKVRNYTDTMAGLHGRLDAYGSVLGDNTLTAARNETDINRGLGHMRSWAANVLPMQLEAANQSGNQWKGAADIMKLAATVMGPWALGGGGGNAVANVGKTAAQGSKAAIGGMDAVLKGGAMPPIWQGASGALSGATAGVGAGALGYAENPAQMAIFKKARMGLPLTDAERMMMFMQF